MYLYGAITDATRWVLSRSIPRLLWLWLWRSSWECTLLLLVGIESPNVNES